MKQFTAGITYFLQEGRDNLSECLNIAFTAAANRNIQKIVIFTAHGLGVSMAVEEFCIKPEFNHIQVIGVTFPVGKRFSDAEGNPIECEIRTEYQKSFEQKAIKILRAHMPFDPIAARSSDRGVLANDLSLVESALNMFGGSMGLCVQAVMIASDAGVVEFGEHVIAITSDTAILAQAAPTHCMLTDFAVREILCKPAVYNIGRGEKAEQMLLGEPQAKAGKTLEGQVVENHESDSE